MRGLSSTKQERASVRLVLEDRAVAGVGVELTHLALLVHVFELVNRNPVFVFELDLDDLPINFRSDHRDNFGKGENRTALERPECLSSWSSSRMLMTLSRPQKSHNS